MKQIFRVLWNGSTQEVAAVAGALGAFLSGFLPGAHGAVRTALTISLGVLSALAVVADAVVQYSEHQAAAKVTAARVTAQGASDNARAAETANQLAGALSGLVAPAAANLAVSPSTAGAGMPPGVVG